jgi:hypothetical protein
MPSKSAQADLEPQLSRNKINKRNIHNESSCLFANGGCRQRLGCRLDGCYLRPSASSADVPWTAAPARPRRHPAVIKSYLQMTQMSADGRQSVGSALQKAGQPIVSPRTPGTARGLECSQGGLRCGAERSTTESRFNSSSCVDSSTLKLGYCAACPLFPIANDVVVLQLGARPLSAANIENLSYYITKSR